MHCPQNITMTLAFVSRFKDLFLIAIVLKNLGLVALSLGVPCGKVQPLGYISRFFITVNEALNNMLVLSRPVPFSDGSYASVLLCDGDFREREDCNQDVECKGKLTKTIIL